MSRHWNPARSELEETHGVDVSQLSLDTLAAVTRHRSPISDPVVQPIVHSSTYRISCVDEYARILQESGYIYGRLGHPNAESVECSINLLERGAGTLVFCSGMAATSAAMFAFLKSGDHVICQNPIYSGTFDVLDKILSKFGVEATYVTAGCDVSEYKKHVKANTRMLIGETPSNPNMTILDLKEFGKLGKSLGEDVITMVDGTFASPYCQNILKWGIDVSVQSCTKYLGGHSDLTAGCLTFADVKHWKLVKRYQTNIGMQLSPHDASLLHRGIRTLHVRMPRHCSTAMKIAEYLASHPKVLLVRYPGLKSHPQHELAKCQMNGYSGMIGIELKCGIAGGKAFVEGLRLAQLAVSLGGVETLVSHPATMTHGPMIMSDKEREAAGITQGYVRMSVGLEDPDDLIKDISQALDKVPLE